MTALLTDTPRPGCGPGCGCTLYGCEPHLHHRLVCRYCSSVHEERRCDRHAHRDPWRIEEQPHA